MTQTHTGDASGDERAGRATRGRRETSERGGLLARISLYLRQVVAELKKVVRPTRNELITYTSVVLVFVLVVMSYVAGLDFAFGKFVLWAFGG